MKFVEKEAKKKTLKERRRTQRKGNKKQQQEFTSIHMNYGMIVIRALFCISISTIAISMPLNRDQHVQFCVRIYYTHTLTCSNTFTHTICSLPEV